MRKRQFELVFGVQVLAHGQWHAGGVGNGGVTGEVVGNRRLLEPDQVVGFEHAGRGDGVALRYWLSACFQNWAETTSTPAPTSSRPMSSLRLTFSRNMRRDTR